MLQTSSVDLKISFEFTPTKVGVARPVESKTLGKLLPLVGGRVEATEEENEEGKVRAEGEDNDVDNEDMVELKLFEGTAGEEERVGVLELVVENGLVL